MHISRSVCTSLVLAGKTRGNCKWTRQISQPLGFGFLDIESNNFQLNLEIVLGRG